MTTQSFEAVLADMRAKFAAVRAAVPSMRTGQVYDSGDGPLTVTHINFGFADTAAVIAGDRTAAPALEVLLTADGRGKVGGWHTGAESEWVCFERWTAAGRVAHGFIDSQSRKLLQSG